MGDKEQKKTPKRESRWDVVGRFLEREELGNVMSDIATLGVNNPFFLGYPIAENGTIGRGAYGVFLYSEEIPPKNDGYYRYLAVTIDKGAPVLVEIEKHPPFPAGHTKVDMRVFKFDDADDPEGLLRKLTPEQTERMFHHFLLRVRVVLDRMLRENVWYHIPMPEWALGNDPLVFRDPNNPFAVSKSREEKRRLVLNTPIS